MHQCALCTALTFDRHVLCTVGSVKDAAAGEPPETRRSGFLTKKTKTMVYPALRRKFSDLGQKHHWFGYFCRIIDGPHRTLPAGMPVRMRKNYDWHDYALLCGKIGIVASSYDPIPNTVLRKPEGEGWGLFRGLPHTPRYGHFRA